MNNWDDTGAVEAKCDENELCEAIEALLFASGDPLHIERIAECVGYSVERTQQALLDLDKRMSRSESSPLLLQRVQDSYTLSCNKRYSAVVKGLFAERAQAELSAAAYEVLAVVAYNQTVTRAQVEEVRGVNSDSLITRLEERGYIRRCGQLEAPGRPGLYECTEEFLAAAHISDTKQLPNMDLLMYSGVRELEEQLNRKSELDEQGGLADEFAQ